MQRLLLRQLHHVPAVREDERAQAGRRRRPPPGREGRVHMKQGARPVVTVTGGEHCTLIGAGVLPLLLLLLLQLLQLQL